MKVLVQKLTVLAVVGSVLTLSSCKKQQQQASVPNYKIITCQKSDATISHEYTCTLQGEQAVEIRPQISGTITRICVDEGQSVKKGQVLFIIDQAPYRDAIRQAQAQVSSAVIVMPYKIHQAIIIPQEATFDLQNKIFVYKVVNKKAKSQEIKIIDHSDGQHYIVLSGLNVGDRIVGEGAGLLSEGTQVEK